MKKIALLLTLILILGCTGCSKSSGVSQEEYDALKQSYEELQSQYDEQAQAASAELETAPEETTEPESAETTEPEIETEEPEAETEEPETETSGSVKASIITDDALEEAAVESGEIRGGTNQNDAFLLPMDTKLYGKVQDGEIQWFAFTTDSTENATYAFTTINKTVATRDLCTAVFDEYGKQLNDYWSHAEEDGTAVTYQLSNLKPNTTYYLNVQAESRSKDSICYMLRMRNLAAQSDAYQTAGSVNEAVGAAAALEGNITVGTNMDEAGYIPMDAKISGTVENGEVSWFAFTTDETENAVYSFTTVNESTGTRDLCTAVFDEYGKQLNDYWSHAEEDGTAVTYQLSNLKPNTTYYLNVQAESRCNDKINYTLRITPPEKPQAQTATIEQSKEDLVFETPFELNSTQVMFVANKAVFIDENAAKTALEPIAEVILAHPDHPILLAGTTATDGTQESCVDLSNRRAAAVKDLLVSAFGVPEAQIQTIGLGYEADPFVRGKDRDANGKFVESEGAKNRRVVVLDIEDPIAKELLGQ